MARFSTQRLQVVHVERRAALLDRLDVINLKRARRTALNAPITVSLQHG
ncbi:MAG: hypothetical protein OXG25_02375 [Gammaproteobacteria bacterium]|nr:hypothetical protein [Gammaproteobacteria bacterium]